MRRKKYRARQRRRQILFVAVVVVVFAAAAGWVLGNQMSGEEDSVGYVEAEDDDDIVWYNGTGYRYNDHLSNYLFLGIDTTDKVETYETQSDAGQADSIFLVSYDRAAETLKALAIPRDTITTIETFSVTGNSLGTKEDHLNIQYAFGDGKQKSCELMKTAVSDLLYGLPIAGYCSLNLDSIPILVEMVGGVEVTVPDDSLEAVDPGFAEGSTIVLTADNADSFVRYRDTNVSQSALVRMNRQEVFLQAFMEKVQALADDDAGIVTDLYEGVQDYMVTSMGNDIFVKLLTASENDVSTETLAGEGTEGEFYDEYRVDDDALYEQILRMFYKEAQ